MPYQANFKFPGQLQLQGDSAKLNKATGLSLDKKTGSSINIQAKHSNGSRIQVIFTIDGKHKLDAYFDKWAEPWIYKGTELHLTLKWPGLADKKRPVALYFKNNPDLAKVFQFFRNDYKAWLSSNKTNKATNPVSSVKKTKKMKRVAKRKPVGIFAGLF